MPKPQFVANCPRCGAKKITFDVLGRNLIGSEFSDWKHIFEVPAVCRQCAQSTIWKLVLTSYAYSENVLQNDFWNKDINLYSFFEVRDYVSLKDVSGMTAPDHVPPDIAAIFAEASTALAVGCPNASASMSRLCLDLVTKSLLPDPADETVEQPNRDQRGKLFDRLNWLFAQQKIAPDLKELSDVVRQHGNDGVHDGTCTIVDGEDLRDFTFEVLERVYTLPGRVAAAHARFAERRSTR